MPKAPTLRIDLIEFLSERGEGPIRVSIPELFRDWMAWRQEQGLPVGSDTERGFRQNLARLESSRRARVVRDASGRIGSIELLTALPATYAERIRSLERERATYRHRFVEASAGAERDLYDFKTPEINAYVRKRRVVEDARRTFAANDLDPTSISLELDPLAEESLALKERLMRVELELLAWRDAGAKAGLALPDWALPAVTDDGTPNSPAPARSKAAPAGTDDGVTGKPARSSKPVSTTP